MAGYTARAGWFSHLRSPAVGHSMEWLFQLAGRVRSFVDFGCWSSEPIALLWGLDAARAIVVDQSERHISVCEEELVGLRRKLPVAFEGRSVEFVVGDMTEPIAGLPAGSFDLAFCEDVLYQVAEHGGAEGVGKAVERMAGVVRRGGYVVAVEPELWQGGERAAWGLVDALSPELARLVETTCRVDLDAMLRAMGLVSMELAGAPGAAYCFRKPR